MSVRAQAVIRHADVVVGYAPYVKMVAPLIDHQTLQSEPG
ncbi:hypothetical protein P4S72_00890 [Vibrio sp. PP-XX7]